MHVNAHVSQGHPAYMCENICMEGATPGVPPTTSALDAWNILMVHVSSNKGLMQHHYRRVLQRMLQQTGSAQETL